MKTTWMVVAAAACGLLGARAFGATAVATYQFQGNFAADQAGVPAATAVDPEATSAFVTDTVLGATRTVWSFAGANLPATDQAGLTIQTAGLITDPTHYSVDMEVELTSRDSAWRRLLDVQNRQSDAGFYVDPSNNLDIFPIAGSSAAWSNNVYHHIVLTDDGTTVSAYLDGVSQFSATTSEMNLNVDPTDNPTDLLNVFLDNVTAGGQGEWSGGNVALVRLWDGTLTADEAETLAFNPFAVAPEPASVGILAAGGLLLLRRRRA